MSADAGRDFPPARVDLELEIDAYRIGEQLGRHEVTLDAAHALLERLVRDGCADRTRLELSHRREIARTAFGSGLRSTRTA